MNERDEEGQSTVELALCLPFVALLIGIVIAVGSVASDRARLWHAAREAARIAAVDPDLEEIRAGAARSGLRDVGIAVAPPAHERVAGEPATVTVTYSPGVQVPVIGHLFERMQLRATAAMAIEVP